eukprot:5656202-Alexandrium_andersonii.AAC.1
MAGPMPRERKPCIAKPQRVTNGLRCDRLRAARLQYSIKLRSTLTARTATTPMHPGGPFGETPS